MHEKVQTKKSQYFYPSTWMVSPDVEEWRELIETAVGPSPKNESVTLESLEVLSVPTCEKEVHMHIHGHMGQLIAPERHQTMPRLPLMINK